MKLTQLIIAVLLVSSVAVADGDPPFTPSPRVASASFTRTDGTNPTYADGDIMRASAVTSGAVSFAISFPSVIPTGAKSTGGYMTSVMLAHDTCNVTGATFDLVVMDDTAGVGAGLAADNAAFQLSSAFAGKVVGVVEGLYFRTYGTTAAGAGRSYAQAQNINIPFGDNSAKKLYFILVARGAFKAKLNGTFTIRVGYEL